MPGKALCDTLWRARGQWCNAAGCSEWCVHLAQDPGPLPEVCSEPSAMAMQLKTLRNGNARGESACHVEHVPLTVAGRKTTMHC